MEVERNFKSQLRDLCYYSKQSEVVEYFVPQDTLLGFWTKEKLHEFFVGMRFMCDPCPLEGAILDTPGAGALKLLSILIWASYPAWPHFHNLYCADRSTLLLTGSLDWTLSLPDENLLRENKIKKLLWDYEIELPDITQEASLHKKEIFIEKFNRYQYIFTPLRFQEGDYLFSVPGRSIIPIIMSNDEFRGRSAAGTVTTAYIPESSLKTRDDHRRYLGDWNNAERGIDYRGPSSQLHRVACKRIYHQRVSSQKMGKQELVNLNLLSKRHMSHLNIAQSIAALSVEEPQQTVILFELPICDLQAFIQKQYAPGCIFSSPVPLVEQMYWIGDALLFLHESLGRYLYNDNNRNAFCHLDIKPENILVYKSEDIPRDKWNVGTWKLTDFGIAGEKELKQTSKRGHIIWTLTGSFKLGGRFCAPEHFHEMEIGRAADVWSLGCVLFLVTMMGWDPENLNKMYGEDGLMGRSTNDDSGASNDRFYRKSQDSDEHLLGRLNPHVSVWLDEIEQECSGEPEKPLFGLIKTMLIVDPDKRIETNDFLLKLQAIIQDLRREQTEQGRGSMITAVHQVGL